MTGRRKTHGAINYYKLATPRLIRLFAFDLCLLTSDRFIISRFFPLTFLKVNIVLRLVPTHI